MRLLGNKLQQIWIYWRDKMLASKLVTKIQELIRKKGDKEVCIAGVFAGGIHTNFNVFTHENYYKLSDSDFLINATDISDYFVIDEFDDY